jgi:hypothetical protein
MTTHTHTHTHTHNLIKRWAAHLNRHFSKDDIQIAREHEKIFNITDHLGNTNQNHHEISLHSSMIGTKVNEGW